ncbi:enoyl-CoA hydratase/isomerase family protein [Cognatilysobacter lacus]|uniref:Enoyl-CoA hydratase/isomerase family protein n=1 Tax=Cognatilysobacter lacus TaxID=1643323 RepID=A0A5D8YVE4_9GAMM|nr:enoyl-CoA hydratase/isomerase family protein [Lysobacter lacus]TZF86608.1 enoyl-CoA hydratase/isomerase family protein [Lysobacter lacus]
MAQIETRAHGDIIELRLARGPVNALDPTLCTALRDALAAAVRSGAHGIALTGGPSVFSAGLDVPYLMSLGEDRGALMHAWEAFFGAARALVASPVPIAAGIAGHAPAGGCVLALCCDYRVMARSPDAAKPFRIGLNETQVGLVAPEGIQRLLRRVVGPHRAERLLVGGLMPTTDEAFAIGLVDEVAFVDDTAARAIEWARSLSMLPRHPVLETRSIARADAVDALHPRHIELERFVEAWYLPDTQAALRAVLERLGKPR